MLLDTIRFLVKAGHDVPLVVSTRASPKHSAQPADFEALARQIGAEYVYALDVNASEIVERLRAADAAVAVSVDWPFLVGPQACASFPYGILNAHGGDLPRYRGNAPVAWAMLKGEARVGLTIHRMDPAEFDSGPIALKVYYPVSEQTYIREVFDFIEAQVPILFVRAIDQLRDGSLELLEQSRHPGDVLRCYPRLPSDARLDWSEDARHLARLVHVSAEPFQGAFTYYRHQLLRVWRARAEEPPMPMLAMPGQVLQLRQESGEVWVAAGRGVLILQEVEPEGSSRGYAAGVIRSVRERLGTMPPCAH